MPIIQCERCSGFLQLPELTERVEVAGSKCGHVFESGPSLNNAPEVPPKSANPKGALEESRERDDDRTRQSRDDDDRTRQSRDNDRTNESRERDYDNRASRSSGREQTQTDQTELPLPKIWETEPLRGRERRSVAPIVLISLAVGLPALGLGIYLWVRAISTNLNDPKEVIIGSWVSSDADELDMTISDTTISGANRTFGVGTQFFSKSYTVEKVGADDVTIRVGSDRSERLITFKILSRKRIRLGDRTFIRK